MEQAESRKILQELIKKEDIQNKQCIDCKNPNPQWASLSHGVFLCLQCAGTHRGFGVHISFVRSVSMDTWQPDQIKRMQLGGNKPFKDFMKSYDPQTGGYHEGQSSYDTYHSWAASQYRDKLDATVAGKDWSPSAPSVDPNPPSRPSSAQGLRKSRASGRSTTASSLRNDSASPSPFNNPPSDSAALDQKASNESYFSRLGQANATRSDALPPSQGGKYAGFGSTPPPSQNPAYGMSSASAPTISELQQNPMGALTKGWSLFSSAVVGASMAVNENVIQPGVQKVQDPTFQASVKGYMTEAQKRAATVGNAANQFGKDSFGIDVADRIGGAVGGKPERSGYGQVPTEHDELDQTSALYGGENNYFDSFDDPNSPGTSSQPKPAAASNPKKDA